MPLSSEEEFEPLDDDLATQANRKRDEAWLRYERLDQISRVRALSMLESLELERAMQRLGMMDHHFARRLK